MGYVPNHKKKIYARFLYIKRTPPSPWLLGDKRSRGGSGTSSHLLTTHLPHREMDHKRCCSGCNLRFRDDKDGLRWVEVETDAGHRVLCGDCLVAERCMRARIAAATDIVFDDTMSIRSSCPQGAAIPDAPTDIHGAVRHELMYLSDPHIYPSRLSSQGTDPQRYTKQPEFFSLDPNQAGGVPARTKKDKKRVGYAPRQHDSHLTRKLLNMEHPGGVQARVQTTDGKPPPEAGQHWKPNTLILNETAMAYPAYSSTRPRSVSPLREKEKEKENTKERVRCPLDTPTPTLSYVERWQRRRDDKQSCPSASPTPQDVGLTPQEARLSRSPNAPPLRAMTLDVSPAAQQKARQLFEGQTRTLHLAQPPSQINRTEHTLKVIPEGHWKFRYFAQKLAAVSTPQDRPVYTLVGVTEISSPILEGRFVAALVGYHKAARGPFSGVREEMAARKACERVVFHGTHASLVGSILTHGLQPAGHPRNNVGCVTLPGSEEQHLNHVHVAKDFRVACAYASHDAQSLDAWQMARAAGKPLSHPVPCSVKVLALRMVVPVEGERGGDEKCFVNPTESGGFEVSDAEVLCPQFILHLEMS